jgi:acyl carrier protein
MVEIVFALEEAFGITIPFNANTKTAVDVGFDMSTPAAIAAAIEALPTV